MVIQEEARSIPLQLKRTLLKPQLTGRSRRICLALGVATSLSAMLISSEQVSAFPTRLSQTALVSSSTLYPAVETAQISTGADNTAWLYQGIVQLSYAGVIAWVIALLQNSGK